MTTRVRADWSKGSRDKRRQSYGHWLGFLRIADRLDPMSAPADRFTQEAVKAFIEDTRARDSLKSTAMQVEDLYVLATLFRPDRDWSWFGSARREARKRNRERHLNRSDGSLAETED